jgi:PadR family transcriptional regulator PadR
VLILRTLLAGPTHGHAVAKHIQRTSEDLLQVETGSLYPALHRLEAKGWIAASWELSDKGKRAKYYHLTPLGRKKLVTEQSKWTAFARAMGLILNPQEEAQGKGMLAKRRRSGPSCAQRRSLAMVAARQS